MIAVKTLHPIMFYSKCYT